MTGWDVDTIWNQMTGQLWGALHRRLRVKMYAEAGETPPPEVGESPVPQAPAKEYMTAERWQSVIDSGAGKMPPR